MNKITYVISLLFLLTLTNCGKDVTSYELKKAELLCKDNEGIYSLSVVSGPFNIRVICKDGTSAIIK